MTKEDPFRFDDFDVAYIATKPEPVNPSSKADVELSQQPVAFTISVTQKLTWQKHNLAGKFKELRINKYVQTWMEGNKAFRNWVYTILSAHLAINPLDDINYPLPDQFRDEYGIDSITFETFSHEALNESFKDGRRPQPVLGSSVIHILISVLCLIFFSCSTIEEPEQILPQNTCAHNITWRTYPVERLEIQIKSKLPQVTVYSGRSMDDLTRYTINKHFYNCWSINATDSTGVIVIVEAEEECMKVF